MPPARRPPPDLGRGHPRLEDPPTVGRRRRDRPARTGSPSRSGPAVGLPVPAPDTAHPGRRTTWRPIPGPCTRTRTSRRVAAVGRRRGTTCRLGGRGRRGREQGPAADRHRAARGRARPLEDVPGTGKRSAARAAAGAFTADGAKLRATPAPPPVRRDGRQPVEPTGLRFIPVGVSRPLPVDEINRGRRGPQSALLEAMKERQVSIEGTTHRLPDPFLVMATQNPVEFEGTFALPQAQLDRFLLRPASATRTRPGGADREPVSGGRGAARRHRARALAGAAAGGQGPGADRPRRRGGRGIPGAGRPSHPRSSRPGPWRKPAGDRGALPRGPGRGGHLRPGLRHAR